MRHLFLFAIISIIAISSFARTNGKREQVNPQNEKINQQKPQNKNGMKRLIAYFSATGTTAKVAEQIVQICGGDLYEIKPSVKYTAADLDWKDQNSRSSVEMKNKASRPEIIKDLEDAQQYETIYIGFPIWWYTAPTIINTFMEAYDFSGKRVYLFATSGGSSITKAVEDLRQSYPSVRIEEGKLLNGTSEREIAEWIGK